MIFSFRKKSSEAQHAQGRDGKFIPVELLNWLGRGNVSQMNFNMTSAEGKRLALQVCPPFAMIAGRCGSMMQNAHLYVTDKDGNESRAYKDVEKVLRQPNPLNNLSSFLYGIEECLIAYGFCPLYVLRATAKSPIMGLTIIPPYTFHQQVSGVWLNAMTKDEIVTKTFIRWCGREITLEPYEYTVITRSAIPTLGSVSTVYGSEILYSTPIDTLSHPIGNYMAQMMARGNLIVNGGPKGILYSNDNTDTGNQMMTPKEKEELNKVFKDKYGLVNKLYQVMVTEKKVGYISLGANTDQLKLHEEDDRCTNTICNVLGIQPDLFSQGATFDNKESAKKATYQDVIIPDAENIARMLMLLFDNGKGDLVISLDFTHVSCLQEDRQKNAQTLLSVGNALSKMKADGVISDYEARVELARYMDIDPNDKVENGDDEQ